MGCLFLSLVFLIATSAVCCAALPPATPSCPPSVQTAVSSWHGYEKHSFALEGYNCFVVQPAFAAPGKPWVWRTSFPDYHPEVDLELLHSGYSIGHIDCVDMLGCDASLDLMDKYYDQVRQQWGLSTKPALEAVSRGGLHAYRYAARHPERVACIYADTPVMDLKSWPMKCPDSEQDRADAMKWYGFASAQELQDFRGNPLDLLPMIAQAKIPLRHAISLNDEVVSPEENSLRARDLLRALGHEIDIVSVPEGNECNGHHFPLPEAFHSAHFIMQHTQVLPKGTEYYELRAGLPNCQARFEQEKTGRVVFLGGSITYNPGWRDEVIRYLQQRFPQTIFEFISAGIPSLGSVPHAFRLERDILAHGPIDLLFFEAAVNDTVNYTYPAIERLRGAEGVVRHMRTASPMTDIVQMNLVTPEHFNDYFNGRVPDAIAQHEKVAAYYGCPSLNLSREVFDRLEAGEFTWEGDFADVHPSAYGQQVYANSITRLLDAAFAGKPVATPRPHVLPEQLLDTHSYSRGRFGSLSEASLEKGFIFNPAWHPQDGVEIREGFVDVPAIIGTQPGDEFTYSFEGCGIGLFLAAGPDTGIIEFSVDGSIPRQIDTFSRWSHELHLPWTIMLEDGLAPGRHILQVRITAEHNPSSIGTALRVIHFLVS